MTIITEIAAALAVDAFADEDGYTAHLRALSEEAHREGRRTVELLLAVLADEPDEVRAARADDVRRAGLASHPDTAERGLLLCAADVLDAEGRALAADAEEPLPAAPSHVEAS